MSTGKDAILSASPVTGTGGISYAPLGTTLPTDATIALEAAFKKGGYVGEEGVTRTTDASDDKIRAWGGDAVKIIRTDHSIVYTWQFLESANADTLKLIHGAENVTITPPTASVGGKVAIKHTKRIPPRMAYVLDMLDGATKIREVVADGQITTSGDAVFVHSDVIRYEVTVEAFPDAQEVKAISYMDDPAPAV